MLKKILIGMLLIWVMVGVNAAWADVPSKMSYEGRLTDNAGNPITTATSINFKIYDAVSGGSEIWSGETHNITPDSNGVFSVVLGNTTAITSTVFSAATRYLQITVAGEALSPRTQIVSVGYAFKAADSQAIAGQSATDLDNKYVEVAGDTMTGNLQVPRLEVDAANTYLDRDGGNNMTLTDSVTGTRTLAQLAAGTGGTVTSITQGTGITATPNPITNTGTIAINVGAVPQLGTANTFAGANSFTAAGTALSVTNNASIGGTLSVGSGSIYSGTGSTNTGTLILYNSTNNNTTTLQSGVAGANLTFTLPTNAGTVDYVLRTDGNGVLSWVDAGTGDFLANGTVAMTGNLNMGNNLINNLGVAGASLTRAGAHSLILTTTNPTNVTFPTIGTLATLAGTESLTNKTLSTNSTWNGNTIGALYGGTGINSSAATGFAKVSTGTWSIGTITETKGASFLYPYTNYAAYVRMPFAATITAVRVYCEGGTSVSGTVSNNGVDVTAAITATAGNWNQTTGLTNSYTAGNTLKFYITAVSGAVTSSTVLIDYTRNP